MLFSPYIFLSTLTLVKPYAQFLCFFKKTFPVTITLFILLWKHSLVHDNPETRREKPYFYGRPSTTQAYECTDSGNLKESVRQYQYNFLSL